MANAPHFRLFNLVLLAEGIKLHVGVELGNVGTRTNETILLGLHVPNDEEVLAVLNAVVTCTTEVVLSVVLHVFIVIAIDAALLASDKRTKIREELESSPKKLLMSGFGAGLSWAAVYMETKPFKVLPLIEI